MEDLLQWAISCHGNDHEDVVAAKEMKERAYYIQKVRSTKSFLRNTEISFRNYYFVSSLVCVIQVADGLYSPQVESEQFDSITSQVRKVISTFMDNLFVQQVEVSVCVCVCVRECVCV